MSGYLGRRAHRWLPVLRLLPRAGVWTVLLAVLFNAAIGLLPLGFVYGMSMALDRVPLAVSTSGAGTGWSRVTTAFALALGAFVLQQVLAPFQRALSELVARRVDGYCVRRLMSLSLTRAQLATLEEQHCLNLLSDTRTAFDRVTSTPGDAVAGTLTLIARYTQLIGATVMVGVVLTPWAGLLAGLTALVIRFGQRGSLGRFAGLWKGLADIRREIAYLRTTGSAPRRPRRSASSASPAGSSPATPPRAGATWPGSGRGAAAFSSGRSSVSRWRAWPAARSCSARWPTPPRTAD